MSNPLLARLRTERDELKETIDATLTRAADEARDLTEADDKNIGDADTRIRQLDERITQLSDLELRNAAAIELANKVNNASTGNVGIVRSGNEPLTYHEHASYGFFSDLAKARQGDNEATKRLERHRDEMATLNRAADTVASVQDFVPPKYLVDKWLDIATFGRPVANLIGNAGAPTSEVMRVPRFTTGAQVAWQSTENSALQTFNRTTDYVQFNTDTIGAYYDVSQQTLDFSPVRQDEIIFRQMSAQLDLSIESAIISRNATGWHGLTHVTGKTDVAYNDASPTLGELYAKIGTADTAIANSRKMPGQVIVVSHAMWNWLVVQVDGSGRPLIAPVGPQNAPGSWANRGQEGFAGYLFNYPVVRANVPMAEEATPSKQQLILFRPDDCLLYESAPSFRIFEDVGSANLSVRFRVHKNVAFTAELWPGSVAVISGTGTAVV